MSYKSADAQRYISRQFTAYCHSHMDNPKSADDLYYEFLPWCRKHGHYGWMNLAYAHKYALLKLAFSLQAKIYGYEKIKQLTDESRARDWQRGDDGKSQ